MRASADRDPTWPTEGCLRLQEALDGERLG
jgi:hypothetical protein